MSARIRSRPWFRDPAPTLDALMKAFRDGNVDGYAPQMNFEREELAVFANAAANCIDSRLRAVVVLADHRGHFVGVGSNVGSDDARALLECALRGVGHVDHAVERSSLGRRRR